MNGSIKKTIVYIIILSLIISFPILFVIGGFTFISVGSVFVPTEIPVNRSGEFDFCLSYRNNNSYDVINGTIVCTYKGLKRSSLYSRKWENNVIGGNTDNYTQYSDYTNKLIKLCDINNIESVYLIIPNDGYLLSEPGFLYSESESRFVGYCEKPMFVLFNNRKARYEEVDISVLSNYGFEVVQWQCDQPEKNIYIPYCDAMVLIAIFVFVFILRRKLWQKE